MRLLSLIFTVCLLLMASACRNVDQVLITELEERAVELDSLQSSYLRLCTEMTKYADLRSTMPDSIKNDSVLVAFQPKLDTLLAEQTSLPKRLTDARDQLKSLHQDYTAGAKQTDEVRPEFQRIKKLLTAHTEHIDTMSWHFYGTNARLKERQEKAGMER